MGYYTNFKLNLIDTETGDYISPNSEIYKKIRETFNATFETEKDSVFNCLVEVGCEWKWYSWKEDMKIIAELFPNVCFELEGKGEDREDWWIASFMGNKFCIRRAEITPPDNQKLVWKEN